MSDTDTTTTWSADQLEDYVLNYFERDEIDPDVEYDVVVEGLTGLGSSDLDVIVRQRLTKMKPLTQKKFIGSVEKWKVLKGRMTELQQDLSDFTSGE